MTKFEELRLLALEQLNAFQKYRREVNHFANKLINGLRKYLGTTVATVMCCEVNRAHQSVDEPRPLAIPCFCSDAYWYFELVVNYPSVPEPAAANDVAYTTSLLVGVKKSGSEFLVLLADKEFRVAETGDEAQFYDHLFEMLKRNLSESWTEPQSKAIGFTIPKS
jgi:hypothetical protein